MRKKTYATSKGRKRNFPEYEVVPNHNTEERNPFHSGTENLMELVVERTNMLQAWKRIKANNGVPGCDEMNVDELWDWLFQNWSKVRQALTSGNYTPKPVLKVEIPKPGGKGMRQLGIPTVLDRLIQQALLQVLTPIFDPGFSDNSFGFRPGRSAGQAVQQAREFSEKGYQWVVDMDLEKFFDNVNHDILMSRIGRKVKDRRILKLIRSYLRAGIMDNGVVVASVKGTPQGGPISPLLSNIMLDDLDKELEKRGHKFCRYADDCNIYVRTERSGLRVLESITRFLERKLKLKVNQEKSAVDRPQNRKFLGYGQT